MSSPTIKTIRQEIINLKERGKYVPFDRTHVKEWEEEWHTKLRTEMREQPAAALFKEQLVDILGDKKSELNDLETSQRYARIIFPAWLGEVAADLLEKSVQRSRKTCARIAFFIKLNSDENPIEASQGRLTDQEIEAARAYPLANLLEVKRNKMCVCPFHNDRSPSMYVKNNWAYCFSCGWSGDSIAVFMSLNNADFVTAVKHLAYA